MAAITDIDVDLANLSKAFKAAKKCSSKKDIDKFAGPNLEIDFQERSDGKFIDKQTNSIHKEQDIYESEQALMMQFEDVMQRLFVLGGKKSNFTEIKEARHELSKFPVHILLQRCIDLEISLPDNLVSISNGITPQNNAIKNKLVDRLVENAGIANLYQIIFGWQRRYVEKYGNRIALFVQVGDFYENYGVDNEHEKIGESFAISKLLNATVTIKTSNRGNTGKKKTKQSAEQKDLSKNSRENPLMLGIQMDRIDKWINILLEDNWKVILYKQTEKTSKTDKVKRVFEGIYMPGTDIRENSSAMDTGDKRIVCIYFEEFACSRNKSVYKLDIGMSSCDPTTGYTMVYEKASNGETADGALTEMFRFVRSQNPVMVIIYCKLRNPASRYTKDFMVHYLELETRDVNVYLTPDSIIPDWSDKHDKKKCDLQPVIFKQEWQEQFLAKAFSVPMGTTGYPVIEWLGLNMMHTARVSLVCLLYFISEMNPHIVANMSPPEHWKESQHLVLTNNTINQLNLTESSYKYKFVDERYCCPYKSVLQVIDQTCTAIGSRTLVNRFLNPIRNTSVLKRRYDIIGEIIEHGLMPYFRGQMKCIYDIERLRRKVIIGKLAPRDMRNFVDSFQYIQYLYEHIMENPKLVNLQACCIRREDYEACGRFIETIESTFILENCDCGKASIEENIFKTGMISQLDAIQRTIAAAEKEFDRIIAALNGIPAVVERKKKFSVKFNQNDGYHITCATTKMAGAPLKEAIEGWVSGNPKQGLLKGIDIKVQASTCKIKTDASRVASDRWTESVAEIKTACLGVFENKWRDLYAEFGNVWQRCVTFIGDLDFFNSAACVAVDNRYVRPEVLFKNAEHSAFIDARDVRHPLVEKINTHVEFIPNDVRIGVTKTFTRNGIMIYGINGTGKSIYLKTIPICLIMAQCGMWVPAKSFKFSPFSAIMTRISNSDNLFKGESTFQMEMTELKTIITHADHKTLVLGDETCSGTERDSALGIVSTSIEHMCRRGVNFVFSTHMHEFASNPTLAALPNLVHYHFHVSIRSDETTGNREFVYERKLREGSGLGHYGIEVAKGIGFGDEFIGRCFQFRDIYMGADNHHLLQTKRSKYNAAKVVDVCEICAKKGTRDCPLHTHHLHEQCKADGVGFIADKAFKKNELHNLVVLCKGCHEAVHGGTIRNLRKIQTTQHGIILDFARDA